MKGLNVYISHYCPQKRIGWGYVLPKSNFQDHGVVAYKMKDH